MSMSRPPSSRSRRKGTRTPLTKALPVPWSVTERWMRSSPSSGSGRPARSIGCWETSKTASMKASAFPVRTMSGEPLSPRMSRMASMIMDLPAPVSPVRMEKPSSRRTSRSSIVARFLTLRSLIMSYGKLLEDVRDEGPLHVYAAVAGVVVAAGIGRPVDVVGRVADDLHDFGGLKLGFEAHDQGGPGGGVGRGHGRPRAEKIGGVAYPDVPLRGGAQDVDARRGHVDLGAKAREAGDIGAVVGGGHGQDVAVVGGGVINIA